MTWQPSTRQYACPCLVVSEADLQPYFAVSNDVIKLTPPSTGGA
jgi:hypothetical protein